MKSLRTLEEVTTTLAEPLDKGIIKKRGKGGSDHEFIAHAALAMMMNESFGPLGWSLEVLDYQIVGEPYTFKANKNGITKDYWNVEAIARVKLTVRAIVGNNQVIETVRTAAGAGEGFSGKATSRQAAIHVALTAAQAAAFKRAALYFGPKTGLMLKWEGWERRVMQEYLDASMCAAEEDIESGNFVQIEKGPSAKATDRPKAKAADKPKAEEPETKVADKPKADKEPETKVADKPKSEEKVEVKKPEPKKAEPEKNEQESGAKILADHIDESVLQGISKLKSGDVLNADQIKAIHGGLVGALDKATAIKVWEAAGIKPGPKAKITKADLTTVIQALEEMSASKNGSNVSDNGSNQSSLPTDEAGLRQFISKKIGSAGNRKDLIDLLVGIKNEDIMPNADAGALHALGMNRLNELNQPASDIQAMWAETGFKWGSGIPNGEQARKFVHNLPDQP